MEIHALGGADREADPFQARPRLLEGRHECVFHRLCRGGLGMPLRWWALEERSPEGDRRCQWDFPMLKQVTVLPKLSAADPFAAVFIHKVGQG